MSFHLGKPILIMIIIAAVAGGATLLRGKKSDADLVLWTFAESHRKSFLNSAEAFEKKTGLKTELLLVSYRAENVRLQAMFNGSVDTDEAPDVCEVEIGSVGRYFRPPVDEVGFIPLNGYLEKNGWMDKIVRMRLAPWSKEGVIFGVPHDVHPTTLTYRDDLFKEAGIDLAEVKTWPEMHEKFYQFEQYWKGRGFATRHATEMAVANADPAQVMLLQRGINLVDDYGKIHINNPKVAQTLALYVQMVAGPKRVSGESAGGSGSFFTDVNQGNLCSFITADWRISDLRNYCQESSGKMRMRPLPIFEEGDKPTSTTGGTMIGITRTCKNPDAAWKFIEEIYFSRQSLEDRRKDTDILPPVKTFWSDPVYHQPDPYFANAKYKDWYMGNELYIAMSDQIPARYVTPVSSLATTQFNLVHNKATDYVREYGADGLEAQIQKWLDEAADELRKRMEHFSYD